MFKTAKEKISPTTTKYKILANQEPISYHSWISNLKNSTTFIDFFIDILKSSDHTAYFWEVKPVTKKQINEDFEFVLVKSNSLPNITADEYTFQKYFTAGEKVVSFPNLGGDAQLVVPTPLNNPSHYAHLASFVRNAPVNQVREFWKTTAAVYEKEIGKKTVWLSTAGLGVYWLHVRIDSRPKYYRFGEYKTK